MNAKCFNRPEFSSALLNIATSVSYHLADVEVLTIYRYIYLSSRGSWHDISPATK